VGEECTSGSLGQEGGALIDNLVNFAGKTPMFWVGAPCKKLLQKLHSTKLLFGGSKNTIAHGITHQVRCRDQQAFIQDLV